MDLKRYEVNLFPTYILGKSFAKVNAVGSATALIAILNKKELAICNIGDSGFILIRFKNGEPYCPHKSHE
jgi:serine/threonine protein phosphatase PrpC